MQIIILVELIKNILLYLPKKIKKPIRIISLVSRRELIYKLNYQKPELMSNKLKISYYQTEESMNTMLKM